MFRKSILECCDKSCLEFPPTFIADECSPSPYQEPYISLGEQIRQAHFEGVPLQTTSQIYGYDDDDSIDPIADVRVSRLDNEESQLSKAQWNAMQDDYASKAKSFRDKVKASADDLVKSMSNDESGA